MWRVLTQSAFLRHDKVPIRGEITVIVLNMILDWRNTLTEWQIFKLNCFKVRGPAPMLIFSVSITFL